MKELSMHDEKMTLALENIVAAHIHIVVIYLHFPLISMGTEIL